MKISAALIFASAPLCALAACGDAPAELGQVAVLVYGEPFIEEGIPASAMADGWAVSFDAFELEVRDVSLGGVTLVADGALDIAPSTGGAGHALGQGEVPAGAYPGPEFVLADLTVSGTASKGDVVKRFEWQFDGAARYRDCDLQIEVEAGNERRVELTIHADHLFYDSRVSEEPGLVFQPFADADTDGDGLITRAELEVTDIGAFDPGSEGGIDTLWQWLVAQQGALGHVDGEAHCIATPVTP